jgi:hypothetical protein
VIHERTSKTPLSELQALVGGDIQIIPGWHTYNGARCDVVCNEEGLLLNLPPNYEATLLWQEALDRAPTFFICGDVVVIYGGLK